jgi:hypothetical protein
LEKKNENRKFSPQKPGSILATFFTLSSLKTSGSILVITLFLATFSYKILVRILIIKILRVDYTLFYNTNLSNKFLIQVLFTSFTSKFSIQVTCTSFPYKFFQKKFLRVCNTYFSAFPYLVRKMHFWLRSVCLSKLNFLKYFQKTFKTGQFLEKKIRNSKFSPQKLGSILVNFLRKICKRHPVRFF